MGYYSSAARVGRFKFKLLFNINRRIGDLSIDDAGSLNVTRLPILECMTLQEYVFWLRKRDSGWREKKD